MTDLEMDLLPAQVPGAQPVHAANAALEAWAKANVAARFALAVQRPRDPDVARERLLKECKRPNFCDVARWTIRNRGSGFSIRFAETALRLWGNIGIDPLLVYEDDERRVLNITVTDFESNLTYSRPVSVPKTVERKRLKEGQVIRGVRKNTDGETLYIVEATEQDLAQRQGAEVSKAIRAEGLRLIPGDLLDEAHAQIRATMEQREAKDPDAARKRILDSFAQLNVGAGELKKFLGKELGACTPAELADLRELWTALKEGHTTWTDVTWQGEEAEDEPRKPPARGAAATLDRIRGRQSPGTDPAPPPPAPKAAASPSEPPEPSVDPGASQGPPGEEPHPRSAEESARRSAARSQGTGRLPLGPDLDVHRLECQTVFEALGLAPWPRWTSGRQAAVRSAMRASGIESPSQFWHAVAAFVPTITEDEFGSIEDMADLLSLFEEAKATKS